MGRHSLPTTSAVYCVTTRTTWKYRRHSPAKLSWYILKVEKKGKNSILMIISFPATTRIDVYDIWRPQGIKATSVVVAKGRSWNQRRWQETPIKVGSRLNRSILEVWHEAFDWPNCRAFVYLPELRSLAKRTLGESSFVIGAGNLVELRQMRISSSQAQMSNINQLCWKYWAELDEIIICKKSFSGVDHAGIVYKTKLSRILSSSNLSSGLLEGKEYSTLSIRFDEILILFAQGLNVWWLAGGANSPHLTPQSQPQLFAG